MSDTFSQNVSHGIDEKPAVGQGRADGPEGGSGAPGDPGTLFPPVAWGEWMTHILVHETAQGTP